MGKYTNKGLYSAYDKNNKERQKDDYYATPPWEVKNILNILNLPIKNSDTILEPCIGGGHMFSAIIDYLNEKNQIPKLIGTDIKNRGYMMPINYNNSIILKQGNDCDYMLDDYPFDVADYIIMNPPFKLIEPFCIRSFEIAKKGVLCFARLQFLEGKARYEKIFIEHPPTDIYIYVDRVMCYKDGNFSIGGSSAQAYAWFYWDMQKTVSEPKIHWIRSAK